MYNKNMHPVFIVLIILGGISILFLAISYVCFRLAFYVSKKQKIHKDFELPPDKIYQPYYPQMIEWMKEAKTFNQEKVSVKSYDGYTLTGTYYEQFPDAPLEIMFHGYRGTAQRDMCGGLQRCHKLGRNVLTVEQRGHGISDGSVISFGIKERFDVKAWTEYAYNRFGKDVQVIITGISMGASTVLMASSLDLPENVVGVVADCGYNSIKEVVKYVIRKMHLPPAVFYPFVRLGGLIFGGFDIEETSPEEEVKKSKLPIIFVHGDKDELVPYYMGKKNYDACTSVKELVTFKGAGHGASFLMDPDKYIQVLAEFQKNYFKVENNG